MSVENDIRELREFMRDDTKSLHAKIDGIALAVNTMSAEMKQVVTKEQCQSTRVACAENMKKLVASAPGAWKFTPKHIVAGIGFLLFSAIGGIIGVVSAVKAVIGLLK